MKNILLLGAGALGSQTAACLVPDLRNEIELTVLDFDKVEQRNIEAGTQFYLEDQIGQYKANALQFNIYRWFNKRITACNYKLEDDFLFDPEYFSLVIDTFDNYKSRKLAQDWVTKNSIDCVHAGFSERMTFQVCWDENYTVPDDIVSDFDVCTAEGAAGFIKLAAALTALTVVDFIKNGNKREFIGNRFNIRAIT
jgi:molybdopterin/thiamine biosynthesis adenylyltransferase